MTNPNQREIFTLSRNLGSDSTVAVEIATGIFQVDPLSQGKTIQTAVLTDFQIGRLAILAGHLPPCGQLHFMKGGDHSKCQPREFAEGFLSEETV